ncbi:alkene reductase [Aestuariibacter sp. AA17]|uniref:Alkene reductase n=1 Tax=Fluctibacter corallii TaxID=2984329 RepID=A0ABT3A3Z5_9ALTE|nr:alkene reductase [Aestuariibacter sp. AA17]MCV2883410.1 alkene reductase [Aestuariibacter sp. AA17]
MADATFTTTDLHTGIQLGNVQLNNRIIMAPLTRTRADGDMPTPLMAQYYAQRASAGLIIAEATAVVPNAAAFLNGPAIYSQAHIDAWKQVTAAVHDEGGKIFLQLWHGGRACHPDLNNGIAPVAASALAITNDMATTANGKQPYTLPRELTQPEIADIVEGFRQGAENAKLAGFDGVEIHAANGYLLDNFLRDGSNLRTDKYGGSIANRARLLREVIDAVFTVWDAGSVGVRTSPLNGFNSMKDSNPIALTQWLAEYFNPLGLAYWHLMRHDFLQQQKGDVLTVARQSFHGNLVANMGYSAQEANEAINQSNVDAVAFGVPFISNPDLVDRFAVDAELTEADPSTFYIGGRTGYVDYPRLVDATL